jgi:hypothetical protein
MNVALKDILLPPSNVAGPNQVQSAACGAAASSVDLWGGLAASDRPKGTVFVHFEATVNPLYIRIGATATTATTTANGLLVGTGAQQHQTFLLDPTVDLFADVIGGAAGTVKWYVCSPVGIWKR